MNQQCFFFHATYEMLQNLLIQFAPTIFREGKNNQKKRLIGN
jgi:hypothetical protein